MTTTAETLDQVEAQFDPKDDRPAMANLAKLVARVAHDPAEQEAAEGLLVARLERVHPLLAAKLALVAGALVENGASPTALGRALVKPLRRALAEAARAPALTKALDGAEYEGEDAVYLGARACSPAQVEALRAKDADAVAAWFSLDFWYRAAVAAWARDASVLKEVQADPELAAALEPLSESEGGRWLSLLTQACLGDRFVILVPELREAWAFTADGVCDNGQLTVLLSEALAAPLSRVGASGVASAEALAVARGDGPQDLDDVYPSSFHLYPWQAFDPSNGFPADGRFTWRAPGGIGTFSLPADFQPHAIAPLDGARVMLLVGPKKSPTFGIREIALARMFEPLKARLSDVRQLTAEEERRWTEKVREAARLAVPGASS